MAKQNLTRKVAVEACKREGLKKQTNIAQAIELTNSVFDYLYSLTTEEAEETIKSLLISAKLRLEKKNKALLKNKIKAIKSRK